MSSVATNDYTKGPELVFGLVGPVGIDLSLVGTVLQDVLSQVDYQSEVYRLSQLMHELPQPPWSRLNDGTFEETVHSHMTAGNKLCEVLKRREAVALLGVGAIAEGNSSGGWPLRKQRRRGSPAAVTSYGVSEVAQDVALLPLAGLSDRE